MSFLGTILSPEFYLPALKLLSGAAGVLGSLIRNASAHEELKKMRLVSRSQNSREARETANRIKNLVLRQAERRRFWGFFSALGFLALTALEVYSIWSGAYYPANS